MNSRDGSVPEKMDLTEENIEKTLQDKGLNAPRLTPEQIDGVIVDRKSVV